MAFMEVNLEPLLLLLRDVGKYLFFSDPCILFLSYSEFGGEGKMTRLLIYESLPSYYRLFQVVVKADDSSFRAAGLCTSLDGLLACLFSQA